MNKKPRTVIVAAFAAALVAGIALGGGPVGPTGLQRVAHDSSLTGSGTTANPLSVATSGGWKGAWSSGSAPYGTGSIVYDGTCPYTFGANASTSVEPCFDFGDLSSSSLWQLNAASSSNQTAGTLLQPGYMTLINNSTSQSAAGVYKTAVAGWDKRRLIVDAQIESGADRFQFGIYDGSASNTFTATDGILGQSSFWGVDIEVYSGGTPGVYPVAAGATVGSIVANGNVTSAGANFDRWYLDLVDNGAGAGTMTMTLYRNAYFAYTSPNSSVPTGAFTVAQAPNVIEQAPIVSGTLYSQWTVTRPTYTNWKFAVGADAGGVAGTFRVDHAWARYTGTDWSVVSARPQRQ